MKPQGEEVRRRPDECRHGAAAEAAPPSVEPTVRILLSVPSTLDLATNPLASGLSGAAVTRLVELGSLERALREQRFDAQILLREPEEIAPWLETAFSMGGLRSVVLADRTSVDLALSVARYDGLLLPPSVAPSGLLRAVRYLRSTMRDLRTFVAAHGLSPQEARLLGCALHAMNNDEAAEVLGCQRSTVSSYWNRIFKKTNVRGQRDVLILLLHHLTERRPLDWGGEAPLT